MKRSVLFLLLMVVVPLLSVRAAQQALNFKVLNRSTYDKKRRDYRYERKEDDRPGKRGDYRYQKNGERTVLDQANKQPSERNVLIAKKGGDRELSRQLLAKGQE